MNDTMPENLAPPVLNVAYASDRGPSGKRQEDALMVDRSVLQADLLPPTARRFEAGNLLLAIADGIGGSPSGDVASKALLMALDSLYFSEDSSELLEGGWITPSFLTSVHARFVNVLENDKHTFGSGSTLVVAQIRDNRLCILNVGDSPAYLFHEGGIRLISHPHSGPPGLLARYVDAEEEGVYLSRPLTSAFIADRQSKSIQIATVEMEFPHDAGLLLCSDGLSDLLHESGLLRNLDWSISPRQQVEAWLAAAKGAGPQDNISLVWVRQGRH
ncbi:MAG: serine/threonine-protein phosphatase [Magnetococcales bacterium]|nr:serine/threonine-protein phosphatase [Magnetococcales bacterium]MBF0436683.1 serine/threonine-protein phosphatase [Magnetococcales bacterium]